MKRLLNLLPLIIIWSYVGDYSHSTQISDDKASDPPYLIVLGTAQDAGFPQIGCNKDCCQSVWNTPDEHRMVVSLGLVDPNTQQTWMIDATPDFKTQSKMLSDSAKNKNITLPNGIFLTHAHMGHYTGLMQLGREALNANAVIVYAMERMCEYLRSHGPWSQLVDLNNIQLKTIKPDSAVLVAPNLRVVALLIPHRGEYTETAGFRIDGPNRKALFIPDIDKWNQWDRDIRTELAKVDVAFLDATFYQSGEVGNRDMSEIPHPFVEESMRLFDSLPASERRKIQLIHFNHTNPLLDLNSEASKNVMSKGYCIASEGFKFYL